MRISNTERLAIKTAVISLDPNAQVYLFGSRADDDKKGGDIDLLILSQKLKSIDSLKILKSIFDKIEEQKIDIIITNTTQEPFVELALKRGIEL